MNSAILRIMAVFAASFMVAALTPEAAVAHSKGKTTTKSSSKSSSTYSSSTSSVDRRLQELENEVSSLRSELNRARSTAPAKVQELETRQSQLEQQLVETQEMRKDQNNLVFFRGGYAAMEHARNNELLLNNDRTNALGLSGSGAQRDGDGWYAGAGLDFRLTNDVWGLTDLAAVDAEVMFQYMNFGSSYNALVDIASNDMADKALGLDDGQLPAGTIKIKNQLTQFTLAASPKIKFNLMNGDLRPWIIPFGLSINVISPPSSGVTVLNPGLMLGTGVEYRIWKGLWAGLDFRYNFTGDDLSYKATVPGVGTVYNKTDTDGLTTGAYLGFGF